MKYCLKCGAENADNAKFCTECGAALNTTETIDTTTEILSYSVTEKSNTSEEKYTYNYSTDNNQTNNQCYQHRHNTIGKICSKITLVPRIYKVLPLRNFG